jgi:hypothetical protein
MPVSALFRRSNLGVGWYVIREDINCELPDPVTAVYAAVISAGACSVSHGGMFQSTRCATALPGGCIYEKISGYGFGGLPDRTWIHGARALRHVMRLLDFEQPRKRLSGEAEASIPPISELVTEWDDFAHQDRLTRIGKSLGILRGMLMRADLGDPLAASNFEPIVLPAAWSVEEPPPGVAPSDTVSCMFDPRIKDSWFWVNEWTSVRYSTGNSRLTPDGELKPN